MPGLWLGLAAACLLILSTQAQSPSPALTAASLMEGHATEYGSARVRTELRRDIIQNCLNIVGGER